MHKLAIFTLGLASALAPALAQNVTPADRYEGTQQLPLKKPADRAGASPSAAIAAPAMPARPAPPAGVTSRNQAAPPPDMGAISATPVAVRPSPPVAAQAAWAGAEASPPPRTGAEPREVRRFVIRRAPDGMMGDVREFELRRGSEMAGAPARVIIRRRGDHDDFDGPGRGEWSDDGQPSFHHDDHEDEPAFEDDWDEDRRDFGGHHGDAPRHHGHVPDYGYGPHGACCSGGMITETITTTTTYPATVERQVVRGPGVHPPRHRSKMRRR